MLAAFLLGLSGSLGHCVGMCSGVMLLVSRGGSVMGWRMVVVHVGRVSAYVLLGVGVGVVAQGVGAGMEYMDHQHHGAGLPLVGGAVMGWWWPGVRLVQGGMAVVLAGVAVYFALALLGRVPSPEVYLVAVTRRWGRAMRWVSGGGRRWVGELFGVGVLWGLLPCGLVLTALLIAAAAGSVVGGALAMGAFGVGTCPALVVVGWLARRGVGGRVVWSRYVAAVVVMVFGVQMALRGVAFWGWVEHRMLGGVMLW